MTEREYTIEEIKAFNGDVFLFSPLKTLNTLGMSFDNRQYSSVDPEKLELGDWQASGRVENGKLLIVLLPSSSHLFKGK